MYCITIKKRVESIIVSLNCDLNLTDWSVSIGHGPFSHMFDGRFLPSIGNETKVMLLYRRASIKKK